MLQPRLVWHSAGTKLAGFGLVALVLHACGASTAPAKLPASERWAGRGRECVRPFLGGNSPYREALGGDDAEDPVLAAVPPETKRTLRAAGLSALVARALALAADERGPPSIGMLAARQDLSLRLISLETQLSAVIFEAECTGELIEAMTFELEDRADLRELRLALGSLVVGAVTATVAGIWDLAASGSVAPPILGLTGGVGSAALGGAAFLKRSESMRYEHPRNLLAPVVKGSDDDELFPRFVFRLLVLPAPDGGPSPRERLLLRWQELIEESVGRSRRQRVEQLLYGAGGDYEQELLALREHLYDALESELNAQARDLELLDRYLVRALEQRDAQR